jgi:hypothetical protein
LDEPDTISSLTARADFPAVIRQAKGQPLTPTDHFWTACAHVQLGHPLPAIEHLTRSRLEGYETAAAMLGLVYQAHQETRAANNTLETIQAEHLDTTGQMLHWQTSGGARTSGQQS